jgi:hypothetical protein
MRQYPVPQFIEKEAKITFFLTFRQFIYLMLVGLGGYIFFKIFPFSLFIIIYVPIALFVLALGFVSWGGEPLPTILKNYLSFLKGSKQYFWKKKKEVFPKKVVAKKKLELKEETPLKIGGESRLKNLKIEVETKTK